MTKDTKTKCLRIYCRRGKRKGCKFCNGHFSSPINEAILPEFISPDIRPHKRPLLHNGAVESDSDMNFFALIACVLIPFEP